MSDIYLLPGQIDALKIKKRQHPSEWTENNFILTRSYASQGKIKLFPWQIEPINSIEKYDRIIFISPTQTGKSLLTECIFGWMIDQNPMNVMIVYSKGDVVKDVFDERLKPMILEIPTLRQYWDNDYDNLTKRRIKLKHMVARVAAAGVRSDIGSWNAGTIIGDEVAKWPRKQFDAVKLLSGRKHASRMIGREVKELYCTSPIDEQDRSYSLSHAPGSIFLQPHFKCPHCGLYQVLSDYNIREKPNPKGERDHNPERIRAESAAFYDCVHCKKVITEEARVQMSGSVIWAAINTKTGETCEKITPKGEILGRKESKTVIFNWNRLVDVTWTFSECLASYFEAMHSPEGTALQDYQNEDMARWVKTSAHKLVETFLQKRAKQSKYSQFGTGAYVPDEVMLLLVGMDTQDDGFYWVVRGFGKNMESWLIRADFFKCEMDQGQYNNPGEVHDALIKELNRWPYQKRDGSTLPLFWGLIDRGGHRADDVDYICSHSPFLNPYIGSTRKDGPLIRRNEKGLYLGNTEQLSRTVDKWMKSDIWHLPKDIQYEYCQQVTNQYEQEYTDTRGNTKKRWVTMDDHGQPDHLRDAENLIVGSSIAIDLQGMLFSDVGQEAIEKHIRKESENKKRGTVHEVNDDSASFNGQTVDDYLKSGGWS